MTSRYAFSRMTPIVQRLWQVDDAAAGDGQPSAVVRAALRRVHTRNGIRVLPTSRSFPFSE